MYLYRNRARIGLFYHRDHRGFTEYTERCARKSPCPPCFLRERCGKKTLQKRPICSRLWYTVKCQQMSLFPRVPFVFFVSLWLKIVYHKGTKDTKISQRKMVIIDVLEYIFDWIVMTVFIVYPLFGVYNAVFGVPPKAAAMLQALNSESDLDTSST